jgi:phosphate transport system substrate-binding protein
MNLFNYPLLFGAAVLAGAINSISGGGSFISFPALIFVGVSPIIANATNTTALWPGVIASVKVYQKDIKIDRSTLFMLAAVSLFGGLIGSLILIHTTPALFSKVIPYLLLIGTLLITFNPTLKAWLQKRQNHKSSKMPLPIGCILFFQFLVSIYGGFFGAGLGILMFAILSLMGLSDMKLILFYRTLLSALINGISIIPLVMAGVVAWNEAVLMAVGALVGGYWAADYARRLSPLFIRRFVIGVGAGLTLYFFLKEGNIQALLIIAVIALIVAAAVWLWGTFKRFTLQPPRYPQPHPLADRTDVPLEWIDPAPPHQRTTLMLLVLLIVQSLALIWSSRAAITQAWAETTTAIAQSLPQSKNNNCRVPSTTTTQDRSTYMQICHAMQDVLNVPDGRFFYGGTMGAAALRSENFLKEIHLAHPNFQLRYLDPMSLPPDSTTGIRMLLNGELSFAESQRPLQAIEYQQAQDWGFTLKQIPVAMTGVAFYTHPGINLMGLSLDQIKRIYIGQITNWSKVGGPNTPIIPVSQDIDASGSTLSLLLRNAPRKQQQLADKLQRVRDTTTAVRKVAATPGAIGFGTQVLVANQRSIRLIGLSKGSSRQYISPVSDGGQINKTALQDGRYPVIQRIFVIVRQDETLDEMAGTAYANLLLSEKGQSLIEQAGYLPIRYK